jgi:hypothetical protein
LRRDAKVEKEVEYNWLRDGAYTAAVVTKVPLMLCQRLAGHRAPGITDHYVARNPEIVGPACEAVYKHYFHN